MWRDPIVDAVREARRQYVASTGGTLESLIQDLKRREAAGYREVVSFLPRAPDRKTDAA